MGLELDEKELAQEWTAHAHSAPPVVQLARPSPSGTQEKLAALAAVFNTNESIRHRADDVGLQNIVDIVDMVSIKVAAMRAGKVPLTAAGIALLRHTGTLLAEELEAQFDGEALDVALVERVRLQLASPCPEFTPIAGKPTRPARHGFYLSVHSKFWMALAGALGWMLLSIYLAQPWIGELTELIGIGPALFAITGIAIVPGFMNAFLVVGLTMDSRPGHTRLDHYPAITILIAAYDEAGSIVETLASIEAQAYPGQLEVIVVDDGSTDATATLVVELAASRPWLRLIRMPKNGGKAKALNCALAQARASLIITVDADSYLYHAALQSIVERYFEDPRNTRAVAGTVLVRNSRASWIAAAQEWDYFHGISAIKRVQSLFQGTLVAQGAFSLYDRATLHHIGGWPDCVGEDIVLTWAILKEGYRIGHSEEAYLFTNAPVTLLQFVRQRQRWSRGMIEGFKKHPTIMLKARLPTVFIYWNMFFPLLDLAFTLCFIPGIILALFGNFAIVGPMTLTLLPMGMGMNLLMFKVGKKSFMHNHLKVRRNLSW